VRATSIPETTDIDPEPSESGTIDEAKVPEGGWRERMRSNPVTRLPYRITVFIVGLLCILAGVALAVLPGPLTIPPVLLGLWIWSWEFRFAQKFFESFRKKAHEAWVKAKRRPVTSALITVFGLAAAGVAMWAVVHYDLVAKAKEAVGL